MGKNVSINISVNDIDAVKTGANITINDEGNGNRNNHYSAHIRRAGNKGNGEIGMEGTIEISRPLITGPFSDEIEVPESDFHGHVKPDGRNGKGKGKGRIVIERETTEDKAIFPKGWR